MDIHKLAQIYNIKKSISRTFWPIYVFINAYVRILAVVNVRNNSSRFFHQTLSIHIVNANQVRFQNVAWLEIGIEPTTGSFSNSYNLQDNGRINNTLHTIR